MEIDFSTLEAMRRTHPAWRLLCANNAPLMAAFLYAYFVKPNERFMAQADLVEVLDDYLHALSEEQKGEFPLSAQEYLNDWASDEHGWLRKFYPEDSDEPHFELTPATEKALGWLDQFRCSFPVAESFLMDMDTFLHHKEFWGYEQKQETRNLPRLTSDETKLYNELKVGTHGNTIRLEQERIRFGWLQNHLRLTNLTQ